MMAPVAKSNAFVLVVVALGTGALGFSSPRPPLLSVAVWDENLADETGEPIATMDVRLDGEVGSIDVLLPGRIGFSDVRVTFTYATTAAAA